MKLTIVVPVYNKYNFTKSALDSLTKLPSDHEIIIVDNGSTDETRSLKDNDKIKYIRNESNLGFAKACNIGYKHSLGESVLFLNNDIRVKSNYEDWTNNLLKYSKDYLVGPTMGLLDKDFNFIKESNLYLNGKSYMSGWCLCSSKDLFEKLNLRTIENPEIFSEEFGIAYFEDTDLSFRARELKINFKVVEIPVVHFGQQTSRTLNTHRLYAGAKKVFDKKWKER